jgi:hypothetical protein
MNCSQLLERRPTANWEKPSAAVRDRGEDRQEDSSRWSAVRALAIGLRFTPRIASPFRTSES